MTFATFDARAVISSCNSRFFGFISFTHDFFRTLNLGFEVYHNSRYKKTGVNMNASFPDCANAIIGFRRCEQDVAVFQTREFWNQSQYAARHNAALQQQLRETEEAFQHEARFATHSHDSLLDAYKKLNKIQRLITLALKDIEKARKRRYFGRMPAAVLNQYHEYLIQQWGILKQEREDIVNHMLYRLIQAAKDPFLENADTLPDIANDLKEKGVVKKSYRIPVISDNKFTPKLFQQFHRILKSQGSSEVSKLMRELPWLQNFHSLAQRFRVNHLVPELPKRPKFLYFLHNLRYHWFDDFYEQAKIDSTLHYLQMASVAIETTAESVAHRVLALHSAETAFQLQFARIQRARQECQRGFKKYFSAVTLRFLLKIEDVLKLQQYELLREKINLLGCISVAPMEALREIRLYHFIRSFPTRIPPDLKQQYDHHVTRLEDRISPNYERHLKRYFSEWAYYASLKTLTAEQLQEGHERAEKDEAALMAFLPLRWSFRVEKIRELRRSNQLKAMEIWAGTSLLELFRERPKLLQQQIQDEIQHLAQSLEEYIREYVEDFNYTDQKNYLMQLITLLHQEGITEAQDSHRLSRADKSFLISFPEINFFINVMLKLKSAEKLFPTLNNIPDVKHHLDEIYRFIKRQEGEYLHKNKAKFVQLFCREATLAEKKFSIYPFRRIIR